LSEKRITYKAYQFIISRKEKNIFRKWEGKAAIMGGLTKSNRATTKEDSTKNKTQKTEAKIGKRREPKLNRRREERTKSQGDEGGLGPPMAFPPF